MKLADCEVTIFHHITSPSLPKLPLKLFGALFVVREEEAEEIEEQLL